MCWAEQYPISFLPIMCHDSGGSEMMPGRPWKKKKEREGKFCIQSSSPSIKSAYHYLIEIRKSGGELFFFLASSALSACGTAFFGKWWAVSYGHEANFAGGLGTASATQIQALAGSRLRMDYVAELHRFKNISPSCQDPGGEYFPLSGGKCQRHLHGNVSTHSYFVPNLKSLRREEPFKMPYGTIT